MQALQRPRLQRAGVDVLCGSEGKAVRAFTCRLMRELKRHGFSLEHSRREWEWLRNAGIRAIPVEFFLLVKLVQVPLPDGTTKYEVESGCGRFSPWGRMIPWAHGELNPPPAVGRKPRAVFGVMARSIVARLIACADAKQTAGV